MQSVYFQILSPCQIHSAQRMWLREWNLAQCAFLSFSLYIYILWRILVAQWIDCWKGNTISGYSHIPASRKWRIAEVMRHLWKSSWPLCSTQGQLWSTTYCDLPWWYAGPFEKGLHIQLVCLKLAKLKVKTEHLVAQLAQVQVSSLSWSLHRNNLISKCGLWSALQMKYRHFSGIFHTRICRKENPMSYLLLSVHVYGFSPNICPQSQNAGYIEKFMHALHLI